MFWKNDTSERGAPVRAAHSGTIGNQDAKIGVTQGFCHVFSRIDLNPIVGSILIPIGSTRDAVQGVGMPSPGDPVSGAAHPLTPAWGHLACRSYLECPGRNAPGSSFGPHTLRS